MTSPFLFTIYLSSTILICLCRFALSSRREYCCCGGDGVAGGGMPVGGLLPISTLNSAINVCTIRTRANTTTARTLMNIPQSIAVLPRAIGAALLHRHLTSHLHVIVNKASMLRPASLHRACDPRTAQFDSVRRFDLAAFYKCPLSSQGAVCETNFAFIFSGIF